MYKTENMLQIVE